MSSTNKTTYYELPQFVDNDIFNPLVDDNDAYDKIDTALHNIADAEADDASEIVGIKSRLDSAEDDIDALEAQNGNSVLTTTAQTLSGAVNELDADVSALDGRLDIVEDDINNASTGIKANINAINGEIDNINGEVDKCTHSYNTVADMVADVNLQNGMFCKTNGYYIVNDGGKAEYVIVQTGTPNGGKIIALSNGLFAEQVFNKNIINILTYGAKNNDNTFDNKTAIDNAINDAPEGSIIFFPTGTYYTSKVTITKRIVLAGAKGTYQGVGTYISPVANDTIFHIKSQDVSLTDLYIYRDGDYTEVSEPAVLVLADNSESISGIKFTNVSVSGFNAGFSINNTYISKIDFCRVANCVTGFYVHNGTSMELDKCWALACSGNGYVIENMTYSKVDNCACDQCDKSYVITDCHGLVLNACGSERSIKTPIVITNSDAVVNGYNGYQNNTSLDEDTSVAKIINSKVSINGCYENDLYFDDTDYCHISINAITNSIVSINGSNFRTEIDFDNTSVVYGNYNKDGGVINSTHALEVVEVNGTTNANGIIDSSLLLNNVFVVGVYAKNNSYIVTPYPAYGSSNRWQFKFTQLNGNPVDSLDVEAVVAVYRVNIY